MECGKCEGKEYQYSISDFEDFIKEHSDCFDFDEIPHFSIIIENE